MKKVVLLLFLAATFIGCNDKEKREKALKALEKNQQLRADFESQIEGIKNRINALEQQLAVTEDEINRVKEYQFLRTVEEREQQIRNAVANKQQVEEAIIEAKNLQLAATDSINAIDRRIQAAKEIIAN